MKRLLFVLIAVCFLFVGCWTISGCSILNQYVATDTGALVVKKAGRMAGIVTGFETPGDIQKMIEYCDALLAEKDEELKKRALEIAYDFIYNKYGKNAKTVILMSEVTDIIGLVVSEFGLLSFTEAYDFMAMDMFVTAFRDGLILTK